MADRVAVFNQGRLEQFGPPSQIYDEPRTLFVNTFVGAANLFEGVVKTVAGKDATVTLTTGATLPVRITAATPSIDDRVTVCIRPEQLRFAQGADGIAGEIEMGLPLGSVIVHEVRLANGQSIKVAQPREAGMEPLGAGTKVNMTPTSSRAATVFRSA